MFGREQLPTKSTDELLAMRRAGLVVAELLAAVRDAVRDGITTWELDAVAAEVIARNGARSNFLGYHGFPAVICTSVNEQVVHGIPGDQVLHTGDLLSIDGGAIVDGWHGDSAISLIVGGDQHASAADRALVEATRESMWAGIGGFREGRGVYELGGDIQDSVHAAANRYREAGLDLDFEIVDGYTGHGIGREMHMEPTVFNERVSAKGPRVRVGATVAIEPMVTLGTFETEELDDGWTVITLDGSRAAHWEHTVACTPGGLWVLTAPDGGATELAAHGLPFGPLAD
ncbi:methionyl aminopeptidase [Branchiibius hedensis]|uniref:Methionine aminopeptidase n=1 Tax=Branchiibius hedensis TaxID=672460 RepID=A0A2Y8ZMJ5_9MICO|nr:type I methionyl aminopeptidase [Branchiibius hedensis]PWJ24186.1 methionyl aminopeptidase [Branchiibius hedensis]SSA33004.1 methionyl aminopeptidase [Branchiibius hedensis]